MSVTLDPAELEGEDPIPSLLPQGLSGTPLCSLWTHQLGHCHPCLCHHGPFLSIHWWLPLDVFKTCLKVTSHIVLEATLIQYNLILTKDPIPNEDLLSYKWPGSLGMLPNAIETVTVTSRAQTKDLPDFLSLCLCGISPGSTSLMAARREGE